MDISRRRSGWPLLERSYTVRRTLRNAAHEVALRDRPYKPHNSAFSIRARSRYHSPGRLQCRRRRGRGRHAARITRQCGIQGSRRLRRLSGQVSNVAVNQTLTRQPGTTVITASMWIGLDLKFKYARAFRFPITPSIVDTSDQSKPRTILPPNGRPVVGKSTTARQVIAHLGSSHARLVHNHLLTDAADATLPHESPGHQTCVEICALAF